MSTYPFCEPASDGVHYLQRIVEILGNENASRILSTDLKGPGHDQERAGSIISAKGYSGADMLQWHFDQGAKFGFAGWWIWAYQDMADTDSALTGDQKTGIRTCAGAWKPDLLEVIRRQAVHRLNDAAGSRQTAEKKDAAVRTGNRSRRVEEGTTNSTNLHE